MPAKDHEVAECYHRYWLNAMDGFRASRNKVMIKERDGLHDIAVVDRGRHFASTIIRDHWRQMHGEELVDRVKVKKVMKYLGILALCVDRENGHSFTGSLGYKKADYDIHEKVIGGGDPSIYITCNNPATTWWANNKKHIQCDWPHKDKWFSVNGEVRKRGHSPHIDPSLPVEDYHRAAI